MQVESAGRAGRAVDQEPHAVGEETRKSKRMGTKESCISKTRQDRPPSASSLRLALSAQSPGLVLAHCAQLWLAQTLPLHLPPPACTTCSVIMMYIGMLTPATAALAISHAWQDSSACTMRAWQEPCLHANFKPLTCSRFASSASVTSY